MELDTLRSKTLLNRETVFFWLSIIYSTLTGLLVYKENYWAAVLYIPVNLALLSGFRTNIVKFLSYFYFGILVAYLSAMFPFIIPAIREFARVPASAAIGISFLIVLINTVPYFLPLLSLLFVSRSNQFWWTAVLFAMAGGFWPNMGNLSIGDCLAQYDFWSPVIQTMGVAMTTSVFSFTIVVIYKTIIDRDLKSAIAWPAGLCCLIALIFLFQNRLNPSDEITKQMRIAVVQANNTQNSIEAGDIQAESDLEFTKRLFANVESEIKDKNVQLVAFPEGAFGPQIVFPWDSQSTQRYEDSSFLGVENFVQTTNSHLLIQAVENVIDGTTTQSLGVSPVSQLYSNQGGHFINFAFKNHLVPMLEYVPGAEKYPILKSFFPWATSRTSSVEAKNFEVLGFNFRTLICYDALFAEPYYKAIKNGAEFFVSLTNNFYLREGSHFQLAITKSRVIEFGRPLFYAANYADSGLLSKSKSLRLPGGQFFVEIFDTNGLAKSDTFYSRSVFPFLNSISGYAIFVFYVLLFTVVFKKIRAWELIQRQIRIYYQPVLLFLFLLTIYFSVTRFIIQRVYIPTSSMYPSIEPGAMHWICRYQKNYKRGDIVSATWGSSGENIIKRIILMPGEQLLKGNKIRTAQGELLNIRHEAINSRDEKNNHEQLCLETIGSDSWPIPCDAKNALIETETQKIPENQYFLLGDNRNFSTDSRVNGPVPAANLSGTLCGLTK